MDKMELLRRVQERLRPLRIGVRAARIVTISFLLVATGLATGLSWAKWSEAERLSAPISTGGTPAIVPGSFADLAARLAPAVVNIKVTIG